MAVLHEGDFLGQTALTREPVIGNGYAVGEVTVLQIDRDTLEHLLFASPTFCRISVMRLTNAASGRLEVAAANGAAADDETNQGTK